MASTLNQQVGLICTQEIVQIAVDAGVKKIIPHVYSSIIDKTTGDTNVEDVKTLHAMMAETLK